MCAANISEVMDVCVRVHGNAQSAVREKIEWLTAGGLEVVPLDLSLALAAGALRAGRYRKGECEISLGDSMAAALAAARRQPLVTSDPDLARACWAEGIEVLPLPDSRGRRPRRA
jgi:predicted nucleic acid-binding protein